MTLHRKARPTIRDVAAAAGVAVGTASRALNRSGRVSADAVAAVTQAARRLGYEPDAIAQSMRTRSTGVVGLLVSDFANPLYARILGAVEARLQQDGVALPVGSLRLVPSAPKEKEFFKLMNQCRSSDGRSKASTLHLHTTHR